MGDEIQAIGVEAYTYLYPLVLMEVTRRQATNAAPGEHPGRGPLDTFVHLRQFPDAEFRDVVRPNFDTLYSVAWLDLTGEPRVITAPDTAGRYYLLPLLDMWTDVFAVPGSRTTGTGAGAWAVVPPGWSGELPDGIGRIDAPTRYAWCIARTQTNGPSDYEAVHAVQAGFTVTPLSQWGKGSWQAPVVTDPDVDDETEPMHQVGAMEAREFFTLAADLLCVHPPHASDWSQLARLRRVGLVAGQRLDWEALDATAIAALEAAPDAARAEILALVAHVAPMVNGWACPFSGMGVYGNDYARRAVIAAIGLGANPAEDAVYPLLEVDADGRPLDGANRYELHFPTGQLPPNHAFWSVTMYDAEGFQVANELDRYAIGDRDPLRYGADGSLTLYLQHANPGPEREANWLPAPAGPLGVTMRIYVPTRDVLLGRWSPPPVRRA